MSFGKDQTQLQGVAVFGGTTAQRAANAGRRKKRGGGGGNRPYWADTFKPHETRVDVVRLVPGSYMTQRVEEDVVTTEETAWYEFLEHFNASVNRGAICSGGPHRFNKAMREACHGCATREAESRDNRTMSSAEKYGFAVVDTGLYHRVPQVDRKTGQIRMNAKENVPYTEWVKCTGRGCQDCPRAVENRYGYIQPWIMAKTHFTALNGYATGIGTCCVTCKQRGCISSIDWRCANPACGAIHIDMANSTMTDEQIAEVTNKPLVCHACQSTTFLQETMWCGYCSPAGAQPVRATIFDVDLHVQAPRTGENNSTVLQVVGMTDPKPIDPQFEEMLKFAPDLSKKFAPATMAEQESLWRISPSQPAAPALQAQAPQMGAQAPQVHTQQYGGAPVQQAIPPMQPQVPPAQQAAGYPPPGQQQLPPPGQQPPPGFPPQPQQGMAPAQLPQPGYQQPPAVAFNSMPAPGAPPGPAMSHPPAGQPAPAPGFQQPPQQPPQPAAYPAAYPAPQAAPAAAPAPQAPPLAPPAGGYLPQQ